ncbi:MAG: hypothetical protein FJ137_21955, partial [Deltaproteobacteria bacterium]|nr:hypothetical protein [Deltaproteobacteria bacterium]
MTLPEDDVYPDNAASPAPPAARGFDGATPSAHRGEPSGGAGGIVGAHASFLTPGPTPASPTLSTLPVSDAGEATVVARALTAERLAAMRDEAPAPAVSPPAVSPPAVSPPAVSPPAVSMASPPSKQAEATVVGTSLTAARLAILRSEGEGTPAAWNSAAATATEPSLAFATPAPTPAPSPAPHSEQAEATVVASSLTAAQLAVLRGEAAASPAMSSPELLSPTFGPPMAEPFMGLTDERADPISTPSAGAPASEARPASPGAPLGGFAPPVPEMTEVSPPPSAAFDATADSESHADDAVDVDLDIEFGGDDEAWSARDATTEVPAFLPPPMGAAPSFAPPFPPLPTSGAFATGDAAVTDEAFDPDAGTGTVEVVPRFFDVATLPGAPPTPAEAAHDLSSPGDAARLADLTTEFEGEQKTEVAPAAAGAPAQSWPHAPESSVHPTAVTAAAPDDDGCIDGVALIVEEPSPADPLTATAVAAPPPAPDEDLGVGVDFAADMPLPAEVLSELAFVAPPPVPDDDFGDEVAEVVPLSADPVPSTAYAAPPPVPDDDFGVDLDVVIVASAPAGAGSLNESPEAAGNGPEAWGEHALPTVDADDSALAVALSPEEGAPGTPAPDAGESDDDHELRLELAAIVAEDGLLDADAPVVTHEPAPVEPLYAERATLEPAYAEPAAFEPVPVEPAPAEAMHTEPAYAEPAYAEPAYAEPAYAEPASAEPASAEPAYAEPAYAEPAYAEPAYAEPAALEPAYAEPAALEPADPEPADAEAMPVAPAYAEPADTEPADTEPADAELAPVEAMPAEPADPEPVYAEPAALEPAYAEPAALEPAYAEPAALEPAY